MVTSQYFSKTSDDKPERLRSVHVVTRGHDFKVKTSSGVFSTQGLDHATEILLKEVPPPPNEGVGLDLGSGWGPLALVLAKESPDLAVWAVDVNPRALSLTASNAKQLGLSNITVLDEEEALRRAEEEDVRFNVIWSNPPVRIGKKELQALLLRWLIRLDDSGVAYLVVGKNLGSDPLARWLEDQGYAVTREASKRGFRVLAVRKNS